MRGEGWVGGGESLAWIRRREKGLGIAWDEARSLSGSNEAEMVPLDLAMLWLWTLRTSQRQDSTAGGLSTTHLDKTTDISVLDSGLPFVSRQKEKPFSMGLCLWHNSE